MFGDFHQACKQRLIGQMILLQPLDATEDYGSLRKQVFVVSQQKFQSRVIGGNDNVEAPVLELLPIVFVQ